MPTTIIYPTELKWINSGPAAGWLNVRNALTGNLAPNSAAPYPNVTGADPNWTIQRSLWCFDTMDVPSFATIEEVRLKLHGCSAVGYPGAGTAELWYGASYPSQPFVSGDYDISKYVPSITDFFTIQNGMQPDQTCTLDDPSIVTPYILGGFRFMIGLDVDVNNTVNPPADGTYTFVYGGLDDGANKPSLEVDWNVYLRGTFAGPAL